MDKTPRQPSERERIDDSLAAFRASVETFRTAADKVLGIGVNLLDVVVDARRLKRVSLFHMSW